MNRTQFAWTIQRPDKSLVINMIRGTRRDAINAYRDHLIGGMLGDVWPTAFRRGFRAVKVTVITEIECRKLLHQLSQISMAGKLVGRNKNAPGRRMK